MWSVYLEQTSIRVESTRLLGRVSRRAFYGPLAPLRTRQLASPTLPGPRWVRVRNLLAGISERDEQLLHLTASSRISAAAAPTPRRLALGTEVVGEVVDVGPEVQFFRVGDRVTYARGASCETLGSEPPCMQCAIGNESLCENRYQLSDARTLAGGGWSEEMVLHEHQLFLVPDSLTNDQAVLLEPTARAIHTVLRAQPQPAQHVLVLGAETSGLLTTQAAHVLAPHATITTLPLESYQVELAARMGATTILYPEDGGKGAARLTGARHLLGRHGVELLAGGGFDIIYDTLGTRGSIERALRWTRDGGTVVVSGHQPHRTTLDLTPLWHKEVSVLGALAHGTEAWPGSGASGAMGNAEGGRIDTFTLAAALIREHRMTPERLVTHRFPVREVRRALMTVREPKLHRVLKVLLDIQPVAFDFDAAALERAAEAASTNSGVQQIRNS